LRSEEPVKWLFYGDSITHGALHTYGHRDYVELFAERVRCELGRPMDIVINSAISGDKTRGLLEGFDWRVTQFKPDVVFIMIGMNDCSDTNDISIEEFERNLMTLAEKIEQLGSLAVIQTTCPILPNQSPDRSPYFDSFMDANRRVAEAKGLPLIDHTKVWKENVEKFFMWMNNEFHPNEYGHRVFAKSIFEALDIYDETSCTCRLFLP
jgi:lysophospholipase L1-like esterase